MSSVTFRSRAEPTMSIRSQILGLIGALFALLAGVQYAVQERVLLPSFAALEREAALTDMDRAVRALERELALLLVTAGDYGNWMDTWRYLEDRRREYVDTNLTPETLQALRLNGIALVAPDGAYAWATALGLDGESPPAIDLIVAGRLPAGHAWRRALAQGTPVSGLLTTNHGPVLAALAPVLDGGGGGPARGGVLMLRFLTAEEIARVGTQAQVRLQTLPLAGLPVGEASLRERPDATEVRRAFPDVDGRPALALGIEVPREISRRGEEAVAYASSILLAGGAVVLLLLLAIVNRRVLRPLERVTAHAVAVGGRDDLDARLGMERRDEFGDLAREFDGMVARLAEARRQLVDLSFRAGIAENASGVLHNVGNAMTPLAGRVHGLVAGLDAVPLAELRAALAELADGPSVPARRADLELFVRLAADELGRTLASAREDAAAMARQAELIQRALAEQHRHARAPPLLETVRVADAIRAAVELVPAPLRARLALEIDPAVDAAPALRLPRLTLVQVFQNLVVNAAEAVRDAGHERGRLAVACRAAADGSLELTFADDGAGIDPGHLPRIFERGFTTKPPTTNGGIGLHWSATALGALRGTVRAASDGPGRGATFTVRLPRAGGESVAGASPLSEAA